MINSLSGCLAAHGEEVLHGTPGIVKLLLQNTARLGQLRQSGELKFLRLDFVVQLANYREMAEFIRLGESLNADKVTFSMVLDWGTWPLATFREQCIWRQDHPEFDQFLEVLRDPVFEDPFVDLGNISQYRTLALQGR